MRLWTHHSSDFLVDAPDLVVDPTQGRYWRGKFPDFRYRDVLPRLQNLVGTTQFLWCYTIREKPQDTDLVEWELNLSDSQILRFIRSWVWEGIVCSNPTDWGDLFVASKPNPGRDIHALVLVPLPRGTAKSYGQLRSLPER
jgi:hypothetical protein